MGDSASKVDSYEFLQKQKLVSNKHNRSSVQLHRNVRSSSGASNPTVVSPVHVVDDQSFSDSLKGLISLINEKNKQDVRSILDTLKSNKDIKKNHQLFDLVQEYFINSSCMSDLCNCLEDSLKKAHDSQVILRAAVKRLKEKEKIGDRSNKKEKYLRAMEELKKFKDTENPFVVFAQVCEEVLKKQQLLVDKLNHYNKKIKKKLQFIKPCRTVFGTILTSVTLILRIVQVAVTVGGIPLVGGVPGSVASVLRTLTKTLNSKYKSYHDKLKKEMEIISSMKVRAWVELTDLNEIHVGVDRLEKQLQSLMKNADFALGEKKNVKLGIKEIGKSMYKFKKTLEELGGYAEEWSNDLKKGRLAIKDKINKY